MALGEYATAHHLSPLICATRGKPYCLGLGDVEIGAKYRFIQESESLGPWTAYGGRGYWHNPGHTVQNNWFVAWELQRDYTQGLAIGAEVFHQTANGNGGDARTGFKAGAIINFTEEHHLLPSAGRDFRNGDLISIYVAYQLTLGPS